MEDPYEKLSEVIEEAIHSPFTRTLAIRMFRERNYSALSALLVNLCRAGELNVLTSQQLDEWGTVDVCQIDTGSGVARLELVKVPDEPFGHEPHPWINHPYWLNDDLIV